MQIKGYNGDSIENFGFKFRVSTPGQINGRSRKVIITAPKHRAIERRMVGSILGTHKQSSIDTVLKAFNQLKKEGCCGVTLRKPIRHNYEKPETHHAYGSIGQKNINRLNQLAQEFNL